MSSLNRREFMKRLAAAGAAVGASSLYGCAAPGAGAGARVVVIGGGWGGCTAGKYIRKWAPEIEVTVVERNPTFVSCPISNWVIGGIRTMGDVTFSYDNLVKRWGVKMVRDDVTAVDPEKRQVRLASGGTLGYDRLIVSPGIDFMYEGIPGLKSPAAQERVPHAWKAGPQTASLRKQLEAMRDGGVYAIWIPVSPYRCPPGPYERASMVAHYFKQAKPRSKILILDANPDIQSKKPLFTKAWDEIYPGMIEYRPNSELVDVDAKSLTIKLLGGDVKTDVLNVAPPQKAGEIAHRIGLANINNRWCGIDWRTMESTVHKNVHVLGDSTLAAPAMPKSGHMANQHGKICADAVIALLTGRPVNEEPIISNTCYSLVSDKEAIHVASVHKYDKAQKTLVPVKGAGGISKERNALEVAYTQAWADNLWADMLT